MTHVRSTKIRKWNRVFSSQIIINWTRSHQKSRFNLHKTRIKEQNWENERYELKIRDNATIPTKQGREDLEDPFNPNYRSNAFDSSRIIKFQPTKHRLVENNNKLPIRPPRCDRNQKSCLTNPRSYMVPLWKSHRTTLLHEPKGIYDCKEENR